MRLGQSAEYICRILWSHFRFLHFEFLSFLRSRWLLTFGHQQSARPPGCIQMSSLHFPSLHFTSRHFTSLHFTRRHHRRIHRKSMSLECPNSHSIRSKEPQENSCKLHHYSTTSGQISSSADCKGYLMILLLQTWRDDSKHVTVRSRDRLMISHRHFSVRSQIK